MPYTDLQNCLPRGKLRSTLPTLGGYRGAMFAAAWALLLMVVVAHPAVGAAPAVTGATCAVNSDGWCSNSALKFEGTDLASVKALRIGSTAAEEKQITCADKFAATANTVSCTVAMASSAKAGLYPVTLVLGDQTQVEAGSVLLGALWELPSMQTWTSTTASGPHKVTGQSSDWPSTGDAWSISGTFDPANHYSVLFYNIEAEAAAGNPSQVTCALLTVTASKLTCTIIAANGVMGMYRFLVKDTTKGTLLLGSTSLGAIAVNPPLPAVTGARGECATNSAACVNGAALTISGANFNYRDHAYQQFFVGVTEAQRSAIRLTPTAVSMTDLTANLAVAHGTPAGSYPVFVKVQVCMMHMMSPPRYVGNLVLRSGSIAGFNTEMPTGNSSETEGATDGRRGGMSAGYVAVTILAVVFGVMFLIVLVALTLVCLRKAERHRRLPEGNRFWDSMASDVPAVASERKDFNSDCVVR